MPRDPSNIPQARSAPFRHNDPSQQGNGSGNKLNAMLNLENILLEEFNYASLTAYQAIEDRARISGFYYLLLGTLAAGVAAIFQLSGTSHTYTEPLLIGLLLVAAIMSYIFFVKIIRLRQAHRHSLVYMNAIKEFYISQFQQQMPQIEHVFRWRLRTMPRGERLGSVTFIISALIVFMGSVFSACALFLLLQSGIITGQNTSFLPLPWGIVIAAALFVILLFACVRYYQHSFDRVDEENLIKGIEQELGIIPADQQ
jgi:hypothetical protein